MSFVDFFMFFFFLVLFCFLREGSFGSFPFWVFLIGFIMLEVFGSVADGVEIRFWLTN